MKNIAKTDKMVEYIKRTENVNGHKITRAQLQITHEEKYGCNEFAISILFVLSNIFNLFYEYYKNLVTISMEYLMKYG